MRTIEFFEKCSLHDAKFVLLVDNSQLQVFECYVFLEYRMCPDYYIELSGSKLLFGFIFLGFGYRSCKYAHFNPERKKHFCNTSEMLLSKYFQWSDESYLSTKMFDHIIRSDGCYYCLAASDISLEELEHRFREMEIFDNLFDDFFLCCGEFEGERFIDVFDDVSFDALAGGVSGFLI